MTHQVDMGFDEWMAAFTRECDEQGVEYLAKDAASDKELERLFEEGRTPGEAIELLHFS